MKIVIDDKIPYIKGALEPFAEVVYLPGSKTTHDVVRDADALVTRTRTRCNKDLLEGSNVRFIATATIGYDHIDTDYCRDAGIEWVNAKGCNAESVNQYIASALVSWAMKNRITLRDKTIGIIGVGEVGSRVEKTCKALGMKVLLNDPPRERKEGPGKFVPLGEIQQHADIITLHVPLNPAGEDATFHLVNGSFLEKLVRQPLIINSCRGEVTETDAVKKALENQTLSGFIADCWENEPDIDTRLLNRALYGTPHIAGYSRDGKANGTTMSVRAISRFFNLGIDNWNPSDVELPGSTEIKIDGNQRRELSILAEAILTTYDIERDDEALRNSPHLFEQLRGDYPVRREFDTYTVKAKNINDDTITTLRKLGFKVER